MKKEGLYGFDLKIYTIVAAVLCLVGWVFPAIILTAVVICIEKDRQTKKVLLQLSFLGLILWIIQWIVSMSLAFTFYRVTFLFWGVNAAIGIAFLVIFIVMLVKIIKEEEVNIPYIDQLIDKILDWCEENLALKVNKTEKGETSIKVEKIKEDEIICKSCGVVLKADDMFCKKCGTQVVAE